TRVSAKLAPTVAGVHLSIMIPLGTSMNDIRIGRSASADSAGVMASSTGTAKAAPAPRRNVRRGMDFLVITIAGPPHLEWRAVDEAENARCPPICVRGSRARDPAKNWVVVLFHSTTQRIGQKPLGHRFCEQLPFAHQNLTQARRPVELGAVGEDSGG